jgi:hypothetical protein
MKNLAIMLLIFATTKVCLSQKTDSVIKLKKHTVYVEAFGQGLYNSFCYDKLMRIDKKIKSSGTFGLTLIPHPQLFVFATPISYNLLVGKNNNYFELGLGFTPMLIYFDKISASEMYSDQSGNLQENNYEGTQTNFYSYITPKLGYRYQQKNGGLFFRATITPVLAGINKEGSIKGGKNEGLKYQTNYFNEAAFFGYKAFPWAGISLGWTLKNK